MRLVASREEVIALTRAWAGDRLADGRPAVPDSVLSRVKEITVERAWSQLQRRGYARQFEHGWMTTNPSRPLVGRAFPVQFVPARPDLDELVSDFGAESGWRGGIGGQNTWVVDLLQPGDVLVVDAFEKVTDGPFIGDLLATTIEARTGAGAVINGTVRDIDGIAALAGLTVFCRGVHPSFLTGATLASMNRPVRIGSVTVLPGDVVFGTATGVMFIPPAVVEDVLGYAEAVETRDRFAKERLAEGVYGSGDMDRDEWSDEIEADFASWKSDRAEIDCRDGC